LIKPIWHAIKEDGSPFPMENHPAMITLKTGKTVRDVVMGVYLPNRGEYKWLVINSEPMFNSEKGVESALITFVDITERKHAEQALLESEEKFQKMIDQSPVVFEIYDKNGLQVRVNPAWDKLWQIPRELSVGKWNILKSEQTAKTGWLPYVKKAYSGETVFLPEKEFDASLEPESLGKSRKRWLSTIIYPIKNVQGEVTQIVLMHEDVSEKKNLEKQVQDNERLVAIGQTAGMVGHDLRNPLQSITGEVYLAKGELDSLPDGETKSCLQESIQTIEAQVSYMDKIVSDLQTFVKPVEAQMQIINLKPLITALIAQKGIPKNIQANIQVQDTLTVQADPQLLKRVLINLITNAEQAMPDGGELTVKAQGSSQGKAQIIVEDTGTGISEEIKSKIFTPLFTTKSKGQGFGLAVCKRVIEAQGGTISFESQVGKGTKFIIELPLQSNSD
jgi:signal transduction histidine kinase